MFLPVAVYCKTVYPITKVKNKLFNEHLSLSAKVKPEVYRPVRKTGDTTKSTFEMSA